MFFLGIHLLKENTHNSNFVQDTDIQYISQKYHK